MIRIEINGVIIVKNVARNDCRSCENCSPNTSSTGICEFMDQTSLDRFVKLSKEACEEGFARITFPDDLVKQWDKIKEMDNEKYELLARVQEIEKDQRNIKIELIKKYPCKYWGINSGCWAGHGGEFDPACSVDCGDYVPYVRK
jgi:hypothetical protein